MKAMKTIISEEDKEMLRATVPLAVVIGGMVVGEGERKKGGGLTERVIGERTMGEQENRKRMLERKRRERDRAARDAEDAYMNQEGKG